MNTIKNLKKLGITLVSAITLLSVAPMANIANQTASAKTKVQKTVHVHKHNKTYYGVLLRNRHEAHRNLKASQVKMYRLRHQIRVTKAKPNTIVKHEHMSNVRRQLKLNTQYTKKWAYQLASPKHNVNVHLRKQVRKLIYHGDSVSKRYHMDMKIARLVNNDVNATVLDRSIAQHLVFNANNMRNLSTEYQRNGVKSYSTKRANAKKVELKRLSKAYANARATVRTNIHKYHKAQWYVRHYRKTHHTTKKVMNKRTTNKKVAHKHMKKAKVSKAKKVKKTNKSKKTKHAKRQAKLAKKSKKAVQHKYNKKVSF